MISWNLGGTASVLRRRIRLFCSVRCRRPVAQLWVHNGLVACIHGNNPSSCAVCKTLAEIDALGGSRTATATAGAGPAGRRGRRNRAQGDPRITPVEIITGRGRPATKRSFGAHVAIFLVVFALAAASVWIVAGIFFAIVRLIEVIIVAIVAGTLGYRLGHYRGRHQQ
jgi:hypothetical protein